MTSQLHLQYFYILIALKPVKMISVFIKVFLYLFNHSFILSLLTESMLRVVFPNHFWHAIVNNSPVII